MSKKLKKEKLINKKFLKIPYKLNNCNYKGVNCITLCKLFLNDNNIDTDYIEKNFRKAKLSIGNLGDKRLLKILNEDPVKLMKLLLKGSDVVLPDKVEKYDLVVFTEENSRKLCHLGIMINKGWFLHILEDGKGSRVEQFNKYWLSRLGGFIRLKSVLNKKNKKRILLEGVLE
jgi:hypothetical protein